MSQRKSHSHSHSHGHSHSRSQKSHSSRHSSRRSADPEVLGMTRTTINAINVAQGTTMAMLSAAGPFDAGSRRFVQSGSRYYPTPSHRPKYLVSEATNTPNDNYYQPYQPYLHQSQAKEMPMSRRTILRDGTIIESPAYIRGPGIVKPHSAKHMLHAQELALGGKVLGEVHIDHQRDKEKEGEEGDSKGKHHATIAIVRNTKAPKPKKLFADNSGEC